MADEITLRDYVDTRFAALQESVRLVSEQNVIRADALRVQSEVVAHFIDSRFSAITDATALAATGVEKRLESMNEFRTQLNQQAGTFVTRLEIEDKIQAGNTTREVLVQRIETLEKINANLQGRFWAFSVGVTILSAGIGIALHFIK
jgi:hypothetical protein